MVSREAEGRLRIASLAISASATKGGIKTYFLTPKIIVFGEVVR